MANTLLTTATLQIESSGDGFWYVHCDKRNVLPWENDRGLARLTDWELVKLLREKAFLSDYDIEDVLTDDTGARHLVQL